MNAISRAEWVTMWDRINPRTVGESMGLNQYAVLCNTVKAEWRERWPKMRFDNARYVVHLEDALSKEMKVPRAYIASVKDDELQFDGLAFPLLNQRRAALAKGKGE